MGTIQGILRHQMQFTSLDGYISANNPVRIIEAFVEKLDLTILGAILNGCFLLSN